MMKTTIFFVATLFVVLSAHAAPPIHEPIDTNVVNVPTVEIGNVVPIEVEVVNTPTIQVQSERSRFQDNVSASYVPGDFSWNAEYGPVATGSTLIIEFLTVYSLLGTAANSGPACQAYVLTEPGCGGALAGKIATFYNLPMSATRDYANDLELTYASDVQIFVDENQNFCVRCRLPSDQDTICLGCGQVSFSGYIVPTD